MCHTLTERAPIAFEHLLVVIAACALALCSKDASAISSVQVAVPPPTGSQPVGTRSLRLVDDVRKDPYFGNRARRELLVRFWYPVSSRTSCALAPYSSPKVWRYLSQIAGLELPEVRTNSCLNAPVAPGVHPLILVTHGYTGMATDYTFITEDLASRGYVVASVAHTYEDTAVEFPDGRLLKSIYGTQFRPDSLRMDDRSIAFAGAVRLRDLSFVLDEISRLNSNTSSPFAGALDTSRIGIVGHSLGAEVALVALTREPRFKAAVAIDPVVGAAEVGGTSEPVLILTEGRVQWSALDCKLWRNLSGPRLLVNFQSGDHDTPSDSIWLGNYVPQLEVETGAMGPEKTITAIRNYIADFLDTHLRGKLSTSLLNSRSAEFTGANVTTQKQALCGEFVSR